MKQLPNIITSLRIAGSSGLLLCDVTGLVFWIIYGLCGISDIADGWLARKLKCVTMTGALLDSAADICFVACCAWKLLPILELPQWLWLWAGGIVLIKVVNQFSAFVKYGRCIFPHTLANKATGFMLFIVVGASPYGLPSNGGRTCPSVHGNEHCGLVPTDDTIHEPPHAQHTIPATATDRPRSRWTCL